MTHELPTSLPESFDTQVDLGGLMTVLAHHLYSTPEVAVRELVQNAHDSITRRRLEDPAFATEAGSIRVAGDASGRTLTVVDTGAGLTEPEIHQYLATVGLGYTRSIREQTGSQELIGLFGLGFLSAFVLAEQVTLRTTSFQQPELGWCYQSVDGRRYSLRRTEPRSEVGTEVQIRLRPQFKYVASATTLQRLLGRYCALLSVPIRLGDATTPINDLEPPWRRKPAAGEPIEHPAETRRRRLEFATRFDERFGPLCTMPVEPAGRSDARGLLWVQDARTYGTSDNRQLAVYVRGMLLDDDARDLLPSWAGFVGGVVESNDLTPTASREDLQQDEVYHEVKRALQEALIAGLAEAARDDPHAWRRVLLRHNEALLGASLVDPRLFALLADDLTVPTSQGDLPVRSLRVGGQLHVAIDSGGGFEEMLCRAMRTPVAKGERYAVVPFLREWVSTRGGQLVELGTDQGNVQLFRPGRLDEADLEWLRAGLADGETLVPAHFAPVELPLVLVPDRDAELKRRLEADEADARISAAALRLARTFAERLDDSAIVRMYVNLDNAAVHGILEARREGRPEAEAGLRMLWALKVVLAAGSSEFALDLNRALAHLNEALLSIAGKTVRTQER